MAARNHYLGYGETVPQLWLCILRSLLLFAICIVFSLSSEVEANTISTVAGSGTEGFNSDGIPATAAHIDPEGGVGHVSVNSDKDLYIADPDNHRVRRVDFDTGMISTIAGTGTQGNSGDGGAATSAQLNAPLSVVVASNGALYISDTYNNRIRKVTVSTGIISSFGGAIQAPRGLAIDGSGNLYVAAHDEHRVYKIDSGGNQSVIAGTGAATCAGDGAAATTTSLRYVHDVALDSNGNVYMAENACDKIRKLTVATGVISTVAGTGARGSSGDGGIATSATLHGPRAIILDDLNNIYIADAGNEKVRRVEAGSGNISTFAGTGTTGFSGDGGDAASADLNFPIGLAADCEGSLYIYDGKNNRIRKVTLTNPATCPGGGAAGSSSSSDQAVRYVPFASKYLLMVLIAVLVSVFLLRKA